MQKSILSFSIVLMEVLASLFCLAIQCEAKEKIELPESKTTEEHIFEMARPTFGSNSQSRPSTKPVLGVVLGGGGTRGAAHVGVLKVLRETGVPINCIAGTSIGAIIGGLYSAGVPLKKLENHCADNTIMKAFISIPVSIHIAVTPIQFLPRLLGHKTFGGLYKGTKFRKFLARELPNPNTNIEDLPIPYCAVALSLIDGQPHSFVKGNLAYAMQASSAVPELRRPVRIGEQLYVDGGLVSNLPVEQARSILGANFVIAVDIDERVEELPIETFERLGSIASRLVALELARASHSQMLKADVFIHPKLDHIGLLSRKQKDAIRALKAGEDAAREALPTILKECRERGIALEPATLHP